MGILKRPEDIVVEFIRANVSDPRARYTIEDDTFTATSGQTEFVLTPSTVTNLIRCIKEVAVNDVVLYKWQDYKIDLKNKKVILNEGATLNDKVDVEYCCSASGDEWVYPGMPISTMSASKFPRISVSVVNKLGDRLGSYQAPLDNKVLFQVDVWTKEGYKPTYDGELFTEQDLADLVAEEVENAFIEEINDLYPKFYDFVGLAFSQFPFDKDSQTFRHKQEFSLNGVNVGH
jgi:hypothetical protein